MENIEDFCVSHNYTQRDLLLLLLPIWKIWKKIVKRYGIKVITKLPNSEQSYKGKVKTHNYINRQNQKIEKKIVK